MHEYLTVSILAIPPFCFGVTSHTTLPHHAPTHRLPYRACGGKPEGRRPPCLATAHIPHLSHYANIHCLPYRGYDRKLKVDVLPTSLFCSGATSYTPLPLYANIHCPFCRGYDGKLKVGVLPISLFCSGHTYYIQRLSDRLGLDPPFV